MNINVENERVNRLLHRTELKCKIETSGVTPSRKEITKQIAAKKGVNENLVVVDSIDQEFGKKEATAYVKVYESEKAAQTIEPKHKMERVKKAMEEKAVEEKKEEEPAEETKKEEEPKKEEAPVEKKEEPAEEKKEEAPVGEKPEAAEETKKGE